MHLKVSHVLCREVMRHLSLCLPSGTFLHRSCWGHGWSFRASHSQPLQHPPTLLDRPLCIFECLLLSVTHIGSQNTQWDTDIEINTRLVVRSRTHRDTSHRVKHFVVWFNLIYLWHSINRYNVNPEKNHHRKSGLALQSIPFKMRILPQRFASED